MEKYSSNRQSKLHIKSSERQMYKELLNLLTEWFELFYNEKNKDSVFLNRTLCWKYIKIRKFLNKYFLHEADLEEYIKQLPRVWILSPYIVGGVNLICCIIMCLANKYFFKIYTGISFHLRGESEMDIIYNIPLVIFSTIFLSLLPKQGKAYKSLEDNLSEINWIAKNKYK
jgi:hypothetical protein